MPLPSLDDQWREGRYIKPRILVLEVKNKKHPDGEPMAWLIVERVETYHYDSQDGTVFSASIHLFYRRITAKYSPHKKSQGWFVGSYSCAANAVSLTSPSMSKGAVFLDLPGLHGQRIGTYLMNEIIRWVKQWPTATVNSIELLAGQANEENKERRNKFYERFGLVFDYADTERREGKSKPILVEALLNVETWKQNITEFRMPDYVANVLQENENALADLRDCKLRCAQYRAELVQAETRPLRWVFHQLYLRCKYILMSLLS